MKNPFIELCGCICLTLLTLGAAACRGENGRGGPARRYAPHRLLHRHTRHAGQRAGFALPDRRRGGERFGRRSGHLRGRPDEHGGATASWRMCTGLMSQLRKPWFTVPGNHETTWSESGCTTFRRLFGHAGCVATRAKGYLFLGYASGPYMKMADGMIRGEDLAWLERQAAAARPGERIVSLCHYRSTGI